MTVSRRAEAEAVNRAFQQALVSQGTQALAEAIQRWEQLPVDRAQVAYATWLAAATHSILTRREKSRELGLAYYRLVRALRTGKTVGDKRRPEPKVVSLQKLRLEFEALAKSKQLPEFDDDAPIAKEDQIEVDQVLDVEKIASRNDELAELQARQDLTYLGPQSYGKAVEKEFARKRNAELSVKDADALREELRKKAGLRQASSFERHVLNGARSTLWSAMESDRECIGWIRLSRTGTPCGWCAMLISRGPVYRSKSSAEESAEGDMYHDNCKCYAEAVYETDEGWRRDPLYALNARYEKLWPQVTKGLSGNDALNAWRTFITNERDNQSQSAQVA